MTYGIWEGVWNDTLNLTEKIITNEVKLNKFGTVSDNLTNCEILKLEEGDLVQTVAIYYSTYIDQLFFITINGFY